MNPESDVDFIVLPMFNGHQEIVYVKQIMQEFAKEKQIKYVP